jgi:hypothetical protein
MNTQERQKLAENQRGWAARAGTYYVNRLGDINLITAEGPRLIAFDDETVNGERAQRIVDRLNQHATEARA